MPVEIACSRLVKNWLAPGGMGLNVMLEPAEVVPVEKLSVTLLGIEAAKSAITLLRSIGVVEPLVDEELVELMNCANDGKLSPPEADVTLPVDGFICRLMAGLEPLLVDMDNSCF